MSLPGDGDLASPGHRGQEGRCRPASEKAASPEHPPLLPGAPMLVSPLGVTQPGCPCGYSPLAPAPSPAPARPTTSLGGPLCSRGTVDTHSSPGASLACGSVASSSPPSFASGAGGAPPPGHPPPRFRLRGRLRPSVCPAGLSAPMGWPALPGVSEDGDPGAEHSDLPALGVPWHRSPASAPLQGRTQGTPLLPEPSCLLGAAWAPGEGSQRPSRVPC